jgi:hypothetical protein
LGEANSLNYSGNVFGQNSQKAWKIQSLGIEKAKPTNWSPKAYCFFRSEPKSGII